MNVVVAMRDAGATPYFKWVWDALRGIRWPQVRSAMLFGLAAWAFTSLINLDPLRQFLQMLPADRLLPMFAIDYQIKAFVLLAAIVIADRAIDDGAPKRLSYIAAAILGCAVGVLLGELFSWAWRVLVLPDRWPASRPWLKGAGAPYYFAIWGLTHWLLVGGCAVFFYADRRAARKTEAHLNAAELDRIRRSKLALESRLQAMQARVEPQFLFNTLAQVERLYEIDSKLAERVLDDLIAYLRAAMPLMRSTSSTVAQEIELARTYLDIVRIRLGNRLAFTIDVPADLGDVRMPPMMLLPLIDHAITYGLEQSANSGSIRIATDAGDGRLRLQIADSGAGFIPESGAAGIASIRERLAALYGANARLDLRRLDTGATEAVMDIPFEATENEKEPTPA
jgi:signal transduction histidine kinase